jgi:hypothetical protein
MMTARQCRHQHSYRLSAYERKPNDFYPTPSELGISLALGLSRRGLDLPRVALDPCGGDGALRGSLAPFGVDMRLTDLILECPRPLTVTLRANRSMPPNSNICNMSLAGGRGLHRDHHQHAAQYG